MFPLEDFLFPLLSLLFSKLVVFLVLDRLFQDRLPLRHLFNSLVSFSLILLCFFCFFFLFNHLLPHLLIILLLFRPSSFKVCLSLLDLVLPTLVLNLLLPFLFFHFLFQFGLEQLFCKFSVQHEFLVEGLSEHDVRLLSVILLMLFWSYLRSSGPLTFLPRLVPMELLSLCGAYPTVRVDWFALPGAFGKVSLREARTPCLMVSSMSLILPFLFSS